ncbi:hypothetical protein FPOAC2_08846 [Fusarium poae]|jgi:hypothetical protein|uniref:Uncharacterized protein n=1 Tax=Fusarium poae TaxID=36050 RepID=A0A1B8AN30_FUSPO|nr:hypothetical protein FPOAC1_008910 [Fusarium poae]KAG8669515.1 hypothetical protein FPOAC1_008910 [Fusarium poae]OBS21736.1 hypothetical protein FPOA_08073 [Fusarium poae]
MCKFMELEFSCSTADNPHRLETPGFLPCDDFQSCVVELVTLKKPDPEKGSNSRVLVRHYEIVKIDGDCQKCAERKTKLIQNEERIFLELKKESEDRNMLPEGLAKDSQEKFVEVENPNQTHQNKTDNQLETICASGPCQSLAIVSSDGQQGMFCKRHTCSATEWDCLLDISTTRINAQPSIYCPAHTCNRLRCGLRIADLSTLYCTRHQTEIYMKFASLQ